MSRRLRLSVVLSAWLALASLARPAAAANVAIWDTVTPVPVGVEMPDRAGWRLVPRDLLTLEADPAKAGSDPGYYGRDYAFQGDAVVENHFLTVVFASARGEVILFANAETRPGGPSSQADRAVRRIAAVAPVHTQTQAASIGRLVIVRNAADEAALEVRFGRKDSPEGSALFTFGKDATMTIEPAAALKGMRLAADLVYGIVPEFVGDDLILSAAQFPGTEPICVPAESVFVGLLRGEDRTLVMTWPKGRQQMKLVPGIGDVNPPGRWQAIEFEHHHQGFCITPAVAPGVWHREELQPAYLEKDVAIPWKRPFPARWKTQLAEEGVSTSFTFKEAKAEIWRGVPGSYSYPVWFEGDAAFYHLSKKVPPRGESLIYFLEGQDTPLAFATPVEILQATLGRPLSASILDLPGRKLRTHHRRGGDGVHRACTCGCTEAIQAVFEAGQEVERKDVIAEALADMSYFVEGHVGRIEEYRRFAGDLIPVLRARGQAWPELKPYLDNLETIAQQILQEYAVQKENMKSPEHAAELSRQTLALSARRATNNLPAYLELLKAWRAMGGAQDYVVAQCHMITRKLAQEAGYGCARQPQAVELAREIRARCRQVLRNPDGYEIWPEY
jgi:hypothetical protein